MHRGLHSCQEQGELLPPVRRFEQEQPDSRENGPHLYKEGIDCTAFKGLQAGTLAKVTKIRATPDAPRSPMSWDQSTPWCSIAASGDRLPVSYEMEGLLLADVEVGQSVYLATRPRW